jgi:uncharacterized metal-binding protein
MARKTTPKSQEDQSAEKKPAVSETTFENPLNEPSCSDCGQRNCYRNDSKYPPFCLTLAQRRNVAASKELYVGDGLDAQLARSAAEVESEYYGRLTRVEETIVFAKKMGVKKLGVASCLALMNESAFFASVARTAGLQTRTAVCKIGSIDKCEMGLPDEDKLMPGVKEACCNPALQAKSLAEWGSELNVVVGLCVGHDALFFRHSQAPTVVLLVKDRVLAHNPAAAIYLSHSFYSRIKDYKTFGKPRLKKADKSR